MRRRSGPTEESIDGNIMCTLCKDYLVDAVTLTECLHFFCRSCLLRHLKKENRCPKCFQDLGKFDKGPNSAFRTDQTLQNLVYKLVPNFFWRQLKKRQQHQKRRHSMTERRLSATKRMLHFSSQLCSADEKVSIVLEYVPMASVLAGSNEERPEPTATTSFRRYFRCAASTRMEHLKKLLEVKLAMTENYSVYFIDSTLRHILDNDYTLQDLIYMHPWNREKPLELLFTLTRLNSDEDKPPVLDVEEMPQLCPESPSLQKLSPTSETLSPTGEEEPQIPKMSVSLSSTAFENGSVHPPIITTCEPPPPAAPLSSTQPPRKRRKSNVPMKKNVVEEQPPGTSSTPTSTSSTSVLPPPVECNKADSSKASTSSTPTPSSKHSPLAESQPITSKPPDHSNAQPHHQHHQPRPSPSANSMPSFPPHSLPSFTPNFGTFASNTPNFQLSPYSFLGMGGANMSALLSNPTLAASFGANLMNGSMMWPPNFPSPNQSPKKSHKKAKQQPTEKDMLSQMQSQFLQQQHLQQMLHQTSMPSAIQSLPKSTTVNQPKEVNHTTTPSYFPNTPSLLSTPNTQQNGAKKPSVVAQHHPTHLKLPTVSATSSNSFGFKDNRMGGGGINLSSKSPLATS